jgi:hypothetical protein
MKRFLFVTVTALALSGCTVFQEAFSPHRELKSPCVCAEDATPINQLEGDIA